eukprot:756535-Hanusia_phi.AAC.1
MSVLPLPQERLQASQSSTCNISSAAMESHPVRLVILVIISSSSSRMCLVLPVFPFHIPHSPSRCRHILQFQNGVVALKS